MQEGQIHGAMAQPVDSSSVDERVVKEMHSTVQEAAERLTFHRAEAERWQRIGRAAAAHIVQMNDARPIDQAVPEDFFSAVSEPDDSPTPTPRGF